MIELENHMVSLPVKDKTIVFYDNMLSPDVIRLVSEKLCLDHTIQIKASSQRISYVELIRLHETNIFDKIRKLQVQVGHPHGKN